MCPLCLSLDLEYLSKDNVLEAWAPARYNWQDLGPLRCGAQWKFSGSFGSMPLKGIDFSTSFLCSVSFTF